MNQLIGNPMSALYQGMEDKGVPEIVIATICAVISGPILSAGPLLAYGLLTRWFGSSADGEPHCRRCNHILRGLSEPRCPECGEAI